MFKVLKTYRDKYSKELIKKGAEIDLAPERLIDFVNYETEHGIKIIEEVKKKTRKKKTKEEK